MNKKVIRIFIAVCLMLALTANIAFASGYNNDRSVDFNYSITKNDEIVQTCGVENCNVRVGGRIFVYYDHDDQQWEINFIKTNFTTVNDNADSYTYQVEYLKGDHSMMDLYIKKGTKKIGEIFFDVTYKGNLYEHIINKVDQ